MFRVLISVAIVFSLSGCALFSKKPESPKVKLQNVDVAEANITDAILNFHFHIENPNNFAIALDQIDYALALGGKPFTKGTFDKKLKVEAHGNLDVQLPIKVQYKNVMASVGDFIKKRQTEYFLEGNARLGIFKIPFNKKGDVKLSDL